MAIPFGERCKPLGRGKCPEQGRSGARVAPAYGSHIIKPTTTKSQRHSTISIYFFMQLWVDWRLASIESVALL